MDRLRVIEERRRHDADFTIIKPFDSDEVLRGRGLYDRKIGIVLSGLAGKRLGS